MISCKLSLLTIFIASSCSFQKENTFEENLLLCRKANTDSDATSYPSDCMKGSLGPILTIMTNRGDSVSTRPKPGKAMVLYFWAATEEFTPPDFVRSDAEDAAAINELYHTFHKQVDFIGFSVNDSVVVNKNLKIHNQPFPQAIGGRHIERIEHITQLKSPLVIFISSNGRVAGISVGSLRRKNLIMERYIPIEFLLCL